MNKLARERIHEDYREILKTDAGMRVFGGIFRHAGLTKPVSLMKETERGIHDLALAIANTVYEVNPYGVADCMTAYEEFIKESEESERRDDADPYGFDE